MVSSKDESVRGYHRQQGKHTEAGPDCQVKYLGLTVNAKGGCEEDVKNRIKAAWQKWKELSGVVCDRKMPLGVKGKVYKIMIEKCQLESKEKSTK